MALISDGSEHSSQGVVVSIQDADSFGGDGLQPGDGLGAATWDGDDLFVPGSDMGIGYDTGTGSAAVNDDDDARPARRSYFSYTSTLARNGSAPRITSSGADRRGGGGGGGGAPAPTLVAAPAGKSGGASPATGSPELRLRAEHCVEPRRDISEPEHANYVVASGR